MKTKKIFDFSCYHGKISLTEATEILEHQYNKINRLNNSSKSKACYLITRLESGRFAILFKSPEEGILQYNIDRGLKTGFLQNPYNTNPFVIHCKMCLNDKVNTNFSIPLKRKSPLPLQELTKITVLNSKINYESKLPSLIVNDIKKSGTLCV